MKVYFLLIILSVHLVISEKARYDNYRLYELTPKTNVQLNFLDDLESISDSYIFLEHVHQLNRSASIIVPPHKFAEFSNFLKIKNFDFKLLNKNLQNSIDSEQQESKLLRSRLEEFGWKEYYPLNDIYKWMDKMVDKYPNLLTTIIVGKSYEGREIRGVKISYKPENPGIFIEGGIHAREWITPATVTYILNELLTSNDIQVRNIAENYNFYIVPVFNPDGYEYSYNHDRLWRKNRKPSNGTCFGTDLNRNWDHHWGEVKAKKKPCHAAYGGSHPFSEVETKSISDYLLSMKGNLHTYLGFHSYSQVLLYPYGHTSNHSENYEDLDKIGKKAAKAIINRYGTEYAVGSTYDVMYPVCGSSAEWAYDVINTKVAFTYELRPSRNIGKKGFILPADQIIPVGEETMDSIVALINEASRLGYYSK